MSKRPSPALALAALALFIALGGTGLAATSGHRAAAKRTKKPAGRMTLTPARVNKLIAAYLAAHPRAIGPQGPKGATGAAGGTGQTGPVGQRDRRVPERRRS